MAARPGALQDDELQRFLANSRLVISRSCFETRGGLGLLSDPPDAPERRVDCRVTAVAVVTLAELGDFRTARSLCSFLLGLQAPSGAWSPTYDLAGSALDGTGEDVTAMVIWALMTYIRSSGDDAFAEQAREQVEEAMRFTRARTLNPYLHLTEATVSVHGTDLAEGYDLWTNCAHAAAFALCHRVYGGPSFRRLALHIRRAISQLMCHEGRYLRRLTPDGLPDPRADVVIIAPHYFGLWSPTERMVMNSADLIERALWNVEVGGYIGYLPFSPAERTGPFGPSPCFGAWMAQYHYELGNKDRAEAIMRWLFDNTTDGMLAETLIPRPTAARYLAEPLGSADGASGDGRDGRRQLLAEVNSAGSDADQDGVIAYGAPYLWAHLEALRALQRGGYIDQWQLGSAEARLGGEPGE